MTESSVTVTVQFFQCDWWHMKAHPICVKEVQSIERYETGIDVGWVSLDGIIFLKELYKKHVHLKLQRSTSQWLCSSDVKLSIMPCSWCFKSISKFYFLDLTLGMIVDANNYQKQSSGESTGILCLAGILCLHRMESACMTRESSST